MRSSRQSRASKQLSDERDLIARVQDKLARAQKPDELIPMKISFEMAAPMAMGHPWLHLDGLIAHFVFRNLLGADYWLLPGKLPVPVKIPLPLKSTGEMWHASVSIFDANESEWTNTTVYKRFDSRHSEMINRGRKRYVQINRGRYKMYMMTLPYLPVKRVRFFACGDIERVQELLSHVQYLGKKAAYGFGAVKSIDVQEHDVDLSVVDDDGVAMRPIPVRLLKKYDDQVRLAWRPPFWDKKNVALCAPPGANVEL